MVSGGEEKREGKGKRKGRKIFGEGNYIFFAEKKGKEENIL